jgi:hypothetical protein
MLPPQKFTQYPCCNRWWRIKKDWRITFIAGLIKIRCLAQNWLKIYCGVTRVRGACHTVTWPCLPSIVFLFYVFVSLFLFNNKRKWKWAKVLYSKPEHIFQSRESLVWSQFTTLNRGGGGRSGGSGVKRDVMFRWWDWLVPESSSS